MIKRYNQNDIDELSNLLKNNGVVSIPTDTVYGLCASINSKLGYEKLIRIKNRPRSKAFPVICANLEQIEDIAIVNETAQKIIKKYMPGPITIVLKKKKNIPEYITNGKETIAIRFATSKNIKKLLLKTGPLFLTSANKSGEEVCTSLDDIEKISPLLDGILLGDVTFSKPSTIVDCSNNEIKILREGPILINKIKNI